MIKLDNDEVLAGAFVKMNKLMSPETLKSFFKLSLFPVIVTPFERLPLDTDTKLYQYGVKYYIPIAIVMNNFALK